MTMTNTTLAADPKKDGIPVELQTQNRKPLSPEQKAKLAEIVARAAAPKQAPADLAKAAEIKQEIADRKKQKAKVRAFNKKAQTVKVPLEGKAALAAIKAADKKLKAEERAAKKAATKPTKAKKPAKAAKPAASKNGASDGPRPGSKLEMVVKLLRRPKGCTSAEVLEATGWPSVSMPQQAKAAGLKLIKDKVKGEVTRYRAA